MKMNRLLLLALPLLALLFTACEGNTDRTWKVQNDSSMNITFVAVELATTTSISESIAPGTTFTITTASQRGGSDYVQTPTETFDAMLVLAANGDLLNRDVSLASSWENSVEQTKKVPSNWEHEYVLVLNDTDF